MEQQGRLRRPFRILGTLFMAAACLSFLTSAADAQAKLVAGSLTGVVRDLAGTPQMGASVEVLAETAIVESARLDSQEAPQRELDKQKQRDDDQQLALDKARAVNKPNFRP